MTGRACFPIKYGARLTEHQLPAGVQLVRFLDDGLREVTTVLVQGDALPPWRTGEYPSEFPGLGEVFAHVREGRPLIDVLAEDWEPEPSPVPAPPPAPKPEPVPAVQVVARDDLAPGLVQTVASHDDATAPVVPTLRADHPVPMAGAVPVTDLVVTAPPKTARRRGAE